MVAVEGTHGPNGSHRTGPFMCFLSKPEAYSQSTLTILYRGGVLRGHGRS